MGKTRFSSQSPVTVISQDGGLTVTEAFGVTQVIQHKKTGGDGMKAAESGVWPQRGRQLLDRLESPAFGLCFEEVRGYGRLVLAPPFIAASRWWRQLDARQGFPIELAQSAIVPAVL